MSYLVSIIIPVYQVSDYIERCLQSVMNQTYRNIECIIVDDATEDDSIEKCERLIAEANPNLLETAVAEQATIGRANVNDNDSSATTGDACQSKNANGKIGFKILRHEVNRGLSAARNTGINAATGVYFFFMDGDDEITPDCIEKLLEIALKHPEVELVMGNYMEHHLDGKCEVFIKHDAPSGLIDDTVFVPSFLYLKLPVGAWNKLMKRTFILQHLLFFKEGIISEDLLWIFFVQKSLSTMYVCKDVTYHYHIRANSITTTKDPKRLAVSYSIIYDEILNHLTPGREQLELNRYVEGFCRRYLEHKDTIPMYKTLMREYKKCSKQNRMKTVQIKLEFASVLGYIPRSVGFLRMMSKVRSMMK